MHYSSPSSWPRHPSAECRWLASRRAAADASRMYAPRAQVLFVLICFLGAPANARSSGDP